MARADAPTVRDVVARLTRRALDEVAGQGTLEVVEAVSRRVPIEFCGAHFGFPGPDRRTMARWSRATQHDMFYNLFADPAIHDANVQAGTEMRAYLKRLIGQRHRQLARNPALDDTLSRLLKLSPPPSIGFDRERIVSNVMGLLVGMVETTSAAAVQALDQLLARPNELQAATEAALADDDATVAAYVWEALRFLPINIFTGRVCVAPYTLAGGSDHATEVRVHAGRRKIGDARRTGGRRPRGVPRRPAVPSHHPLRARPAHLSGVGDQPGAGPGDRQTPVAAAGIEARRRPGRPARFPGRPVPGTVLGQPRRARRGVLNASWSLSGILAATTSGPPRRETRLAGTGDVETMPFRSTLRRRQAAGPVPRVCGGDRRPSALPM
jgi:hypothetical protein